MSQAVVLRKYGGPEELRMESVDVGTPGPGQVRLRQTAIGVNFHDAYCRAGLYPALSLPGTPGIEAVGVVEECGPDAGDFREGDRVAYVTPRYGAYAQARLIDARQLIRLPPDVSDRTAAAVMLKGFTVWMLLEKLRPVKKGDTCLVHAAAGGVGQLLCQWASHLGARVIGTAGTDEKAEMARNCGCEEVIIYTRENFAERVKDLTGGRGVDMAYDSVGKDTFEGSMEALGLRGCLVNYGQASGAIPPFAPSRLSVKSNSVWRPIVFHYVENAADRQEAAGKIFAALKSGVIKVEVGVAFPLREAEAAHRMMEARSTHGSTILVT